MHKHKWYFFDNLRSHWELWKCEDCPKEKRVYID